MRESPPENLVSLLESLRLATPGQVAAVERRARRLARGLPMFTSVWVDALVQARRLTPLQAESINAQRGESLCVGPYVLFRKLTGLGFADVYEARHIETGKFHRLATFTTSDDQAEEVAARLERLVADSAALPRDVVAPVEAQGRDALRFWAACDVPSGPTASEWLIREGRFPAVAVWQIARSMTARLVALEKAGLCHGDLRVATLLLDGGRGAKSFGLRLPFPGLRAAVRPHEGYADTDLSPEVLDGLAPERVRDGTPPNVHGDIYACGCLWWHLLTGRDPLPGGDALTKLQTAQRAAVADPKPLAPDAPEDLLAVIRACVQADPAKRPNSMAKLASMLGPTPRPGRAAVRSMRGRDFRHTTHGHAIGRRLRLWLAGATVVLCAAVVTVLLALNNTQDDEIGAKGGSQAMQQQHEQDTRGVRQDDDNKTPVSPTPKDHSDSDKHSPPSNSRQHLVLRANDQPGDEPIARLPMAAGQRVHGPPGQRITLNVAREGLAVDVPDVVFENIDFVFTHQTDPWNLGTRPAILVVKAPGVAFDGCTFRAVEPSVDAIRWIHPVGPDSTLLSLPNGSIVVNRCTFRNVTTAVDARARGALAFRFANVLHLGSGPLVHLNRSPGPDEPVILSLDRTTLRESGPLMQCDVSAAGPMGKISIETNRCVLSPFLGQPLIKFSGESSPDALLGRIVWTGQGSLVEPGCPIAGHATTSGQGKVLSENALSIDGLVRGKVDFAGKANGPPADSQAVRWLAPLQSDEAPGIDAAALPR